MPEEGTEGLVKYGSERTLNNGNNWKDVVSSLPVEETINGEKYYYFYYVKEVKAPAGFSVSYEGNNGTGQSVIIKNIKDYFPMTFKKIDSTDNSKVLEGATFSLYKDEDCTQIVTFYSDENMQQEATTFTTGSDGKFTVYGLKEGTYYLKEVSAPSGYYLIDHPLKITMDLEGVITIDDKDKDVVQVLVNESNVSDITVVVKDSPLYYLPNSGGIGTHIFTMMGTMLIALAATFYIVNKRNEEGDVS
jgi:LPXTG-motif cell wall-anchored protein